jgi:hypothetical protein
MPTMAAPPSLNAAASSARRAPRLAPDETIAGLMTRTGGFARIDPSKPGTWPSWPQVAGVLAWAVFTGGCAWAAWRRERR